VVDGRRTNNVSIMLKQFEKLVGPAAEAAALAARPLQDIPELAKYFKMLKMHLPRGAVEAKMAAEGVDVAVLDLDPTQPLPPPPEPEAVPLKEDPAYAKYFKMLQMHLPRGEREPPCRHAHTHTRVLERIPIF